MTVLMTFHRTINPSFTILYGFKVDAIQESHAEQIYEFRFHCPEWGFLLSGKGIRLPRGARGSEIRLAYALLPSLSTNRRELEVDCETPRVKLSIAPDKQILRIDKRE